MNEMRAGIAAEAKARAARRDAAARARAKKTARDHKPETAMDDVLRGARQEAARIAVLPRIVEPWAETGAEPWTEPHDTFALRQAYVAATTGPVGRTGTGNGTGHSRALEAAARLFLDDDG